MRKFLVAATILVALAASASAKIYFEDTFASGDLDGWVISNWKKNEGSAGKFEVSAGKFYNDAEADKGLRTAEDYRFYTISKALPADFTNKGKDLVFQFTVKHEQNIDCGGGYLKILPKGLDQENFNGDSKYNIMFGPDICGSSTKRIHVIFEKNGQNHLIKKTIPAESDEYTHLYTLIVRPDNTYEVRVDNKEVAKGSLEEDWDMLPPKEILDPEAKKPEDWVDEKEIVDPEDKKPEGYDDIPKEIVDPDAKKPEDWDDELDGEWEAPMIPNPEFKGEWKPKMIPNPAYKGEWVHPKVPNPEFKPNPELYVYDSNAFVGLEIWQVKAGTIFDNILVADSVAEAEAAWAKIEETKKGEKAMHETQKEEQRQKDEEERKKREAEEAAKKEADQSEEAEEEQKDEL
eukprot:TRINITY_DN7944_c1_g1_i1.p1 TRINITY_DN7944_c1_g1~~TRINITY_DN7944_c1_g1_i1.p1  ORF type:complete len:404 (-),score=173.71 TRINITY_DN7944_c1_g1_i1:59-1270(-)